MNCKIVYDVVAWSHINNLRIDELTEFHLALALLEMEHFQTLL